MSRVLSLLGVALLTAGCAAPPSRVSTKDEGDLFRDDFSGFPAGQLSYQLPLINPAIQEYHYLAHRGVPLGPWSMPICYLDCWCVAEEDGKPYLEQHFNSENRRMMPDLFSPSLVTGDFEWGNYAVEVSVKPLSFDEMAGLVFRYQTNRHHYVFALQKGKTARLAVRLPVEKAYRISGWKELQSVDFPYDTQHYYRLRVENEGPRIRAFVDGKQIMAVEDDTILKGRVGVTANTPARFQDFRVSVAPAIRQETDARIRKREQEEEKRRAENPKPLLWKKFETPKFGAGRNARFGDLDGDGVKDMLIAQNISKVSEVGNYCETSCLTAVTLEGKVLWQAGKPDFRNGLLTCDTPFQIHDLDGDGKNEVAMIKDFKLQILEGATGKLKKSIWMPPVPEEYKQKKTEFELKERPHELNLGDSISFFDLSGKGRRSEIVIKDRYRFFWVYDQDLKFLWRGYGQLGHFPNTSDVDGDGKDEILIGYSMWDGAGKQLWTRDTEFKDHADAVAAGNYTGDPKAEPMVYAIGSDEGFLMFDKQGKELKHLRVGHCQNMSIGKFRPDLSGLQIAAINFWKNPGILTIFDAQGNILQQGEPVNHGSQLLPVNWRGDGQEFVLLSGNVKEGGMIDGQMRRVVMFPEDGHPDLACHVMDMTGDARDEIILWDQERVWIYTQDAPFQGDKIYAPARNPECNDSNYRAQISLPRWRENAKK